MAEWSGVLDSHDAVLVNLKNGQITKSFSFSCLAEYVKSKIEP